MTVCLSANLEVVRATDVVVVDPGDGRDVHAEVCGAFVVLTGLETDTLSKESSAGVPSAAGIASA